MTILQEEVSYIGYFAFFDEKVGIAPNPRRNGGNPVRRRSDKAEGFFSANSDYGLN